MNTGNIEDLILDSPEISELPDSIDYAFVRSKIDDIAEHLAKEIGGGAILRNALKEMNAILSKQPTIVHEMLPEDIGILSKALMEQTNKVIIDQTAKKKAKQTKKDGSVTLARAKELANIHVDDF